MARRIPLSLLPVVLTSLLGDARGEPYIRQTLLSGRRDIEVNVRLSAGYGFGAQDIYYNPVTVGPGAQVIFPIVQNGLIPRLNNALYLGFFFDALYVPYAPYAIIPGGFFSFMVGPMVQWRFSVLPCFSVFSNVGLGIWPWFSGDPYGYRVLLWPTIEAGGNWHFSRPVSLTFSLGYPAARVGLSFGF